MIDLPSFAHCKLVNRQTKLNRQQICNNQKLQIFSHDNFGMADKKNEVVIAVPSDVTNLKDAIKEGRTRCQEAGEIW